MRYLLCLLMITSLSLFACGNTATKKVSPPVQVEPTFPWDSLDEVERNFYVNEAICPEATKMMKLVLDWPLVALEEGQDNPIPMGNNRFLAVRGVEGAFAAIQFRVELSGKVVVEGAILEINGQEVLLLDYFLLRTVVDETADFEGDEDELYAPATGEFFCVY